MLTHEVTDLLGRWRDGDRDALDQIMPLVFDEVRGRARQLFAREPASHTLEPQALISEVYVLLNGMEPPACATREEFVNLLARIMRNILVDYARRRRARKRGRGVEKVSIDEGAVDPIAGLTPERLNDLLDVDRALAKLERDNPRQARILEYGFFLGLTDGEIRDVLGVGRDTAWRDRKKAMEWLRAELAGDAPEGGPRHAV